MMVLAFERREVFTFIDVKTGENTHIDSGGLREWCAANREKLKVEMVPVDKEIARSFLELDNSVSEAHLKKVAGLKELDPIIFGMSGTFSNGAPDVMLVDGHHRYYLAALAWGMEAIPAYVLERAQWEPFRMQLQDMTAEELRDLPPSK